MPDERGTDPLDDALRALCEALRAAAASGRVSADEAAPSAGSTGPGDRMLAEFLSQAALACTASGIRYWGRMLQFWGTALPSLVPTSSTGGGTDRTRVDDCLALLREFAEIPRQELRRLESDLERLAAALERRGRAEGDEHRGTFWRRWEVKP